MRRLGPKPATVRSYLQAFKQILDYEAVPPESGAYALRRSNRRYLRL